MFTSTLLLFLFLSVLPTLGSVLRQSRPENSPELASVHQFDLRHIFVPRSQTRQRFDVIRSPDEEHAEPILLARSQQTLINRQLEGGQNLQFEDQTPIHQQQTWSPDSIAGPNVTDKQTILNLAIMSSDAYFPNATEPEWLNLTDGFNRSQSFGWQADGVRGHVFADQDNSTIIIAIKGTHRAVFEGAETSTKDKINDNLFFSCCCAQQGHYLWHQVCSCATNTFQCDGNCLIRELMSEDNYYRAAIDLYINAKKLYPESTIWLTGHSLGGVLASLLGLTFGHPAVTFETPPDALAARRLGLAPPPGSASQQARKYTGIYHIGNTADPIYMGSCSSPYSLCSLWGYAFESQCHTGSRCVYDTVKDKGWWQSVAHHPITSFIHDVIETYDNVPTCEPEDPECIDCFNWQFNGTVTTTSTTSSATSTSNSYTRTETCKTPGWWGCLDKTTSSSISTTSQSTSTTTCHTPGWFGCNDPTSTSTSSPAPTSTITSSLSL